MGNQVRNGMWYGDLGQGLYASSEIVLRSSVPSSQIILGPERLRDSSFVNAYREVVLGPWDHETQSQSLREKGM